jgi:hypothetical protein
MARAREVTELKHLNQIETGEIVMLHCTKRIARKF